MTTHLRRGRGPWLAAVAPFAVGCVAALADVLERPGVEAPWRGVVTVVFDGTPSSARVDDAVILPRGETGPWRTIDTRLLDDGRHTFDVILAGADGTPVQRRLEFESANGGPAWSGGALVDLGAETGLPVPPQAGRGFPDDPVGAVVLDADGDGTLDVFAWTQAGGRLYRQVAPWRFEPVGEAIRDVSAAAVADLDADGDPDVLVGADSLDVYENTGGILATAPVRLTPPGDGRAVFTAVGVVDLDGDGLLDLLAAAMNCLGGRSHVFRNEGALHFADVTEPVGLLDATAATFALAVDRPVPDGTLQAWFFNEGCTPVHARRIALDDGDDLPVPAPAYTVPIRLSPMGSAYLDLDGDGGLDLWTSGDFYSPVWTAPDFTDDIAPRLGLDGFIGRDGRTVSAWSVARLDADFDGRFDLFAVHQPSGGGDDRSSATDGLFWFDGAGFREVFGDVSTDREVRSCRAAFGADLDGDGDTDLLTGCDDGLRVLRNDLRPAGAGRTVHLRGRVSNPDAIGARLVADGGDTWLVRGSGQLYADGAQFPSIPAGKRVVVTWPTGLETEVPAGDAPVVAVEEPVLLQVAARRVKPRGTTRIEVFPAIVGVAARDVRLTEGPRALLVPLVPEGDGRLVAEITAPANETTLVYTLTVSGRKLPVRPRIFVRADTPAP